MKNKNKGFTLIEILITIAIIGILTGVVLASLSYAKKRSNDSKRKIDISNISLAIQRYNTAKGHLPTVGGHLTASEMDGYWSLLESELKPYIPSLPRDPCGSACNKVGGPFFTYVYSADPAHTSDYTVYARSLETQDGRFQIGTSF
jgi:prepilin-type N-terminal cleavage/methylation domain-containing protein